jgi:putative PIN family toxin of toxin-antitoxin system
MAALISSKGAPRALLLAWIAGTFELLVSPNLLAELGRVLKRPKFRRYVTEREAREFVAPLERFATVCDDPPDPPRLTPDPSDDYLAALAQTHAADFLVSGDPDLIGLRSLRLRIVPPRAFLSDLG